QPNVLHRAAQEERNGSWAVEAFSATLRVVCYVYSTSPLQRQVRDCPSGQLSKKKFIEVYSGFFPDGNAEEFCTHVFRTFDKDNSGRIDFKEFLLAINITSGGDPEEKLEWAYQMYDIDGNGTIERSEMVEIIRVR
ncbi:neuronal calcium sensor 2, partial [Clonorchis sinensis]